MLTRSRARRGLTLLQLLLILALILLFVALFWLRARRAAPAPGSPLDLMDRARSVQAPNW
jgi:hypothetical protein